MHIATGTKHVRIDGLGEILEAKWNNVDLTLVPYGLWRSHNKEDVGGTPFQIIRRGTDETIFLWPVPDTDGELTLRYTPVITV